MNAQGEDWDWGAASGVPTHLTGLRLPRGQRARSRNVTPKATPQRVAKRDHQNPKK